MWSFLYELISCVFIIVFFLLILLCTNKYIYVYTYLCHFYTENFFCKHTISHSHTRSLFKYPEKRSRKIGGIYDGMQRFASDIYRHEQKPTTTEKNRMKICQNAKMVLMIFAVCLLLRTHSLLITSTAKEREKAHKNHHRTRCQTIYSILSPFVNEWILFSLLGPNRSRFVSLNLMLVFILFSVFLLDFLTSILVQMAMHMQLKNSFLSYVIICVKRKLIYTLVVWIDFFSLEIEKKNETERYSMHSHYFLSIWYLFCWLFLLLLPVCSNTHLVSISGYIESLNCFRSKY